MDIVLFRCPLDFREALERSGLDFFGLSNHMSISVGMFGGS
jgi:hypothetical protein